MVTPRAVHGRLPAAWTVLLHTIWLLLLLLLFQACPALLCRGFLSSCSLCLNSLSSCCGKLRLGLFTVLDMPSLLLSSSTMRVTQQGGVLLGMLL